MLAKKLATWLGFLVSLLGLFISVAPPSKDLAWWQVTLVALSLGLFIYFMVDDLRRLNQKRLKTESDVNRYMHNWLSKGGRATIFTNDMTWADQDQTIQELLLDKASRRELTICMPEPTELAIACRRKGAVVLTYQQLQYVPRSRFTIIRDGRMDARIAVGMTTEGVHCVEEYQMGEHAVFAIANDLVEFTRRIGKTGDQDEA